MSSKNKVEVRICGYDYTLMGVESDEYIQRIAHYIDKKMNEVMRANSKLSTSMAAVLTSLNVADDFFKVRESEHYLKADLKQNAEEIEKLKHEISVLSEEAESYKIKYNNIQLELAKREAELGEVRNSVEKNTRGHR